MKYNSNYLRQRRVKRAKILKRLAQMSEKAQRLFEELKESMIQELPLVALEKADEFIRECEREHEEVDLNLYNALGTEHSESAWLTEKAEGIVLQSIIKYFKNAKEKMLSKFSDTWQERGVLRHLEHVIKKLEKLKYA